MASYFSLLAFLLISDFISLLASLATSHFLFTSNPSLWNCGSSRGKQRGKAEVRGVRFFPPSFLPALRQFLPLGATAVRRRPDRRSGRNLAAFALQVGLHPDAHTAVQSDRHLGPGGLPFGASAWPTWPSRRRRGRPSSQLEGGREAAAAPGGREAAAPPRVRSKPELLVRACRCSLSATTSPTSSSASRRRKTGRSPNPR